MYTSADNNKMVKYGIKGTFYYHKSSKKYTVFEPWNSMKNEIQGKKLGMSTMKRQLFMTCYLFTHGKKPKKCT